MATRPSVISGEDAKLLEVGPTSICATERWPVPQATLPRTPPGKAPRLWIRTSGSWIICVQPLVLHCDLHPVTSPLHTCFFTGPWELLTGSHDGTLSSHISITHMRPSGQEKGGEARPWSWGVVEWGLELSPIPPAGCLCPGPNPHSPS